MEPDMRLDRQVRKGIQAVIVAMENDQSTWQARYTADLVCEMVADYVMGRPQPWSYYEPRIREEFE